MNYTERTRRKSSLAFPRQPKSERGGCVRYMEESGATAVFTDVFTALFNETDKPDNPLGWISSYLREKAGDRTELLLSTVEARRNEILELAQELEQLRCQKSLNDQILEDVQGQLNRYAKTSNKTYIDESFIEDGVDSRWQIQPDPFFVGTWSKDEVALQLANIKGLAAEAEDEIEDGEIAVENPNALVSDFAPSDDEINAKTRTSRIPAIFVSDYHADLPSSPEETTLKVEIEPDTATVPLQDVSPSSPPLFYNANKSTETSPQPSAQILYPSEEESENEEAEETAYFNGPEITTVSRPSLENMAVPPPSAELGVGETSEEIEVPAKTEQNTDNLWTTDFSLGKVESQDEASEDEYNSPELVLLRNKLQAKRYRAQSLQEHGWLPWQSDIFEKQSLKRQESEVVIQDVLGTLTLTKTHPDIEKLAPELQKQSPQHKKNHLAKYEWVKKEHGVQQLRQIRKGGAIKDDLQNNENDYEEESQTPENAT